MTCAPGPYGRICPLRSGGAGRPRCAAAARACRRQRLDPAQLAELPLFDAVPADVLPDLLGGAAVEWLPAGTLLFDAGAPADAFYVLLGGQVKLSSLLEDGRESIVEIVEPVATFAEAAMFASGRFPVTAETMADSALVRVRAEPFLAGLNRHRAVAVAMLAGLWRWNRHLAREIRTLRRQTPLMRVCGFLLSLAPQATGAAEVVLPLRKAVIASRLGMEPESLSRVLARLRAHGVDSRRDTVRIADVAALRALCAPDEPGPDAGADAAERRRVPA
ncbi:Crp/Fnr family transcriptional regulator [Azospirillum sp. ST 5-10]